MAARGRRHPVSRRAERLLRSALGWSVSTGAQLPCPVNVALGWDALYLDNLVDLLSLHLLQAPGGRSFAAVLDQYGCDGNLDARRSPVDRQCAGRTVSRVARSLRQRFHRALLGNWHVVDTDARRAYSLASPLRSIPPAIRTFVLGCRLPDRDVRCRYVRDGPRTEPG